MSNPTVPRSSTAAWLLALALLPAFAQAQPTPGKERKDALLAVARPSSQAWESLVDTIQAQANPQVLAFQSVEDLSNLKYIEQYAMMQGFRYFITGEITVARAEDAKHVATLSFQLYRVRSHTEVPAAPNTPLSGAKLRIHNDEEHSSPEQQVVPWLRYISETVSNLRIRDDDGPARRMLLASCIAYQHDEGDDRSLRAANLKMARLITASYPSILKEHLAHDWVVAGIAGSDYEILCDQSEYPLGSVYDARVSGELWSGGDSVVMPDLFWSNEPLAGKPLTGGNAVAYAAEIAQRFVEHAQRVMPRKSQLTTSVDAGD